MSAIGESGASRYISVAELARRTPWSVNAIRRMMQRGQFRVSVHFFRPSGPRGKVVFDFEAVERLIRQEPLGHPTEVRRSINVAAIQDEAKALLARTPR